MRISADASDSGYSKYTHLVTVFLDGKIISDCITADEEKGMVYCYVRDKKGSLAIDVEKQAIKTIEKYGKVKVVIEEHN